MSSASRRSGTRRRMKLSSRDRSRPTTSEIRWSSSSVIRAAAAARFNLVVKTIRECRYCRGRVLGLRLGVVLSSASHFQPVQLLFELMERVVANLVAGAHRVNGLARRLERPPMNIGVRDRSGVAVLRPAFRAAEVRDELMPDRLCIKRVVVLEPRQPGPQRSLTGRAD